MRQVASELMDRVKLKELEKWPHYNTLFHKPIRICGCKLPSLLQKRQITVSWGRIRKENIGKAGLPADKCAGRRRKSLYPVFQRRKARAPGIERVFKEVSRTPLVTLSLSLFVFQSGWVLSELTQGWGPWRRFLPSAGWFPPARRARCCLGAGACPGGALRRLSAPLPSLTDTTSISSLCR